MPKLEASMHNRFWFYTRVMLILGSLVVACSQVAPTATLLPTAEVSYMPTLTRTITASATLALPTRPFTPTATPTPNPTATLSSTDTPEAFPTITYALSSLSTRVPVKLTRPPTLTPGIPAVCPAPNRADVRFQLGAAEFDFRKDYGTPILNFLNAGGNTSDLQNQLEKLAPWITVQQIDLTNDGVPEVVIRANKLYLYKCDGGLYHSLSLPGDFPLDSFPRIEVVRDLNLDGMPEVIVHDTYSAGNECYPMDLIQVLEWDGSRLKNLITQKNLCTRHLGSCVDSGTISMLAASVNLKRTNGSGATELMVSGGVPPCGGDVILYGGHLRGEQLTFMWNGLAFELVSADLDPPWYRFQAIEDGDVAADNGDYARAMLLYQQAITDPKLMGWNPARVDYNQSQYGNPLQTPLPTPSPDRDEYGYLAAYAQYRIMLVNVVEGRTSEAQTVFVALQRKYPAAQAGHTYAELAAAFWNEYAVSNDIGKACSQAIDYADKNKDEILTHLGTAHYAILSFRTYESKDVCPFGQK